MSNIVDSWRVTQIVNNANNEYNASYDYNTYNDYNGHNHATMCILQYSKINHNTNIIFWQWQTIYTRLQNKAMQQYKQC